MAARRKTNANVEGSIRPPAKTSEERENQLIAAAVNLAEKQLISGQASAQVITHYLKLGSSREQLEQQRLKNEVAMLETKRELMESEKRTESLIADALRAMQGYMGVSNDNQDREFDNDED
jgi:hypothetical protein